MPLTDNDIVNVAKLAKLNVSDEQMPSLKQKLNAIINLVDELDQVDTSSTLPLAHPMDQTQPLRADQITENNQRDKLLALAKRTENNLYIVPAAIDDTL